MGLRVAMISRRYWPMVGGAETMMSNLAVEFRRQGADPTLVTAQWRADWPTQMRHRGTPVVRLPSPKPASWGVIRYLTSLTRWLRRNQDGYDAVCVSRFQYDAYAAVTALRGRGVPVVLRAEHAGELGDCRWLDQARFGGRIRKALLEAAAIVAPTEQIAEEVREAGFPVDRVHLINNGLPAVEPRTMQSRRAARLSLAEANRDLSALPHAPVVLAISPFHEAHRLPGLVRAFRLVVEHNPNAALWLIGDGGQREALYEQIVDAGLHHQIFMPGNFDDIDDLMHAADIFVSTTDQEGRPSELLQAMAYGLPVVAADIEENRRLIQSGENGRLTGPGDVSSLANALRSLTADPAERARLGAAGRETVSKLTVTQCAHEHLQLFERCLDRGETAD